MAEDTAEAKVVKAGQDPVDMSALTSMDFAGTQMVIIAAVAVAVFVVLELLTRAFNIPSYVVPKPTEIVAALIYTFPTVFPHLLATLEVLVIAYAIGASVGILLAGIITQFPFAEKIITPYILILVTTPALALVPLLILKFGFGLTPRIIATTLAVGPMVMINASTGFRRTDQQKLALAALLRRLDAPNFHQGSLSAGDADDRRRFDGGGNLRLVDGCGL